MLGLGLRLRLGTESQLPSVHFIFVVLLVPETCPLSLSVKIIPPLVYSILARTLMRPLS